MNINYYYFSSFTCIYFVDNLLVYYRVNISFLVFLSVFRGARKDYLKKIENTYKKWEDVYEKDVNIPYIASDSWNPHCESGE